MSFRSSLYSIVSCGIFSLLLYNYITSSASTKQTDFSMINTKQDVIALFSLTAAELSNRVDRAIIDAQNRVTALCAVPEGKGSYTTIAHELDTLSSLSDAAIMLNVCSTLEYVTSDDSIRSAAHDAVVKIRNFFVDAIENNKVLYCLFKTYVEKIAPQEQLTPEQRYYLQETLDDFKRNGLDLSDELLARCSALKKDIAKLSQDFEANIAQDTRTITIQVDELIGVDPDFIAQLPRDAAGDYILGVDYPTVFTILDTCAVESTRKAIYLAFNNRAYPNNQAVLEQLVAARDELAQLLGMAHYNELCLADQMVQSPERAHIFLQKLVTAARPKQQKEFQQLLAMLPAHITLTSAGTIKPWDIAYIKNQYKKQYFELDEQRIAHYFPMQSTIDGLLHIYEQFFNLSFERISLQGLWHVDLITLAVHDRQTQQLLGYLILDLHPRKNKFTHACHIDIVPSVTRSDGSQLPSVSVVLANFPPESSKKPALLKRDDVSTFFHEFGHALHAILGRTHVGSLSGTYVKRDFVELPSQMLEQWLWDADILKQVSKHYIDGTPLSDELITKIQAVKKFDSGYFVQRQSFLSLASLAFYDKGRVKDFKQIWEDLQKTVVPDIACEPEAHAYLAFGHLTGYGPRYYGYLWSKVFAIDMFEAIKKEGLLNPAAGKRYVDAVLRHGGSKNPNDLLFSYLGRQPSQEAFLLDHGLL